MENITEKIDFNSVWLSLQETGKAIKELAEEHKKTEEAQKKTEEMIQKLTENVNGIGKSNGLVAETLLSNTIENSASLNGWVFNYTDKNVKRSSKRLGIQEEFDMVLENDDLIAIVEIKYRAQADYIDKLANRKIPRYKLLHPNEKRNIVGILACLSFEKDALDLAKNLGIYFVTQSGDSIKVENEVYKTF